MYHLIVYTIYTLASDPTGNFVFHEQLDDINTIEQCYALADQQYRKAEKYMSPKVMINYNGEKYEVDRALRIVGWTYACLE